MSIQQEKFKEIADAIREKTGTTDLIKPIDFASKVDDVYEVGKEAEHKRFMLAHNSVRVNSLDGVGAYKYAYWDNANFKPVADDIVKNDCTAMFRNARIYNIKKAYEDSGFKLDTKGATSLNLAFCSSFPQELPTIDCTNCTSSTSLGETFAYNNALKLIEKIIFSAATYPRSSTFNGLANLTHVIFEGVIGKNGLSLQWSDLDYESLTSIKNCLEDKSTDTSGTTWTVTVGTTNKAKYTDEDILEIQAKGWTVK